MAPMNGWVKMRICLIEDPRVQRIANGCRISVDAVLGKLLRLWAWANAYAKDETVEGYTLAWVDVYVSQSGFADKLVKEGWLDTTPTGIRFVDFGKHNWKEGKDKALAANRKQRERRGASRTCHAQSVTKASLPIPILNTLSPLPSLSPETTAPEGPVSSPPAGERESEKREPEKPKPGQPAPASPANLRAMPCDHPEAAAAAKRVVDHYQRVTRPAHPKGGGIEGALVLLLAGQAEADLRKACDRYAAWCSRHNREPQYREAAKTFFSATGQCGAFLEDDPDASEQPAQLPPIHRAKPREKSTQPAVSLRELVERSKAARQDPANAVAQIEQDARSGPEATSAPPGTKEGSNDR